jgi:hypothetical protein
MSVLSPTSDPSLAPQKQLHAPLRPTERVGTSSREAARRLCGNVIFPPPPSAIRRMTSDSSRSVTDVAV